MICPWQSSQFPRQTWLERRGERGAGDTWQSCFIIASPSHSDQKAIFWQFSGRQVNMISAQYWVSLIMSSVSPPWLVTTPQSAPSTPVVTRSSGLESWHRLNVLLSFYVSSPAISKLLWITITHLHSLVCTLYSGGIMPGSPSQSQEAACGSLCHPGPLIDLTWSHLSPHRLIWPGTCLMCEAGCPWKGGNTPDVQTVATLCCRWSPVSTQPGLIWGSWNLWSYYSSLQQHRQSVRQHRPFLSEVKWGQWSSSSSSTSQRGRHHVLRWRRYDVISRGEAQSVTFSLSQSMS